MRAAAEREWQTALLFSIVDREIGEGMALIDPRLHVHWSNAAARRFMFAEKSANGKAATSIPLNPDIERLVRRALDTGRAASQRFTLDENAHFNLQAAPQEDGYISVVAHPLSYETGPNQFYERFIRRIVHDMRNPLAAIIAHAGNLQNTTAQWSGQPSSAAASANAANAAAAANTAATIEHEAQRLTRLVDSMLFDARLSYVPLALEQVDLLDVIEEVYYQHDERAMREQKSIIVETPPESAPLEADRDLLARALSNLVDNSLKYSRAGAEVRLSLEATAENYLLRVADTGDGIPPEYLPERIFEPLVRARQKDSGSGLGLAIVKKIVQLHHGDITAESELGKGTTFTVCLPK
jgi:two-component system phosphate regulon sensor histidine kinase PhoR